MDEIVDNLEGKLSNLNIRRRRKHLIEVYKQLVPGPHGRKRKQGEYQLFVDQGTGNPFDLIGFVYEELINQGMLVRAKRLQNFYNIDDEEGINYPKY